MKLYYFDKNPNQNSIYELHVSTCTNLPNLFNRIFIGSYMSAKEARKDNKRIHCNVNFCPICIDEKLQKPEPFYKKWFKKK